MSSAIQINCNLLLYLTRQSGVLSLGEGFQPWKRYNCWRKCPDVSVPNLFKGIATLCRLLPQSVTRQRSFFYGVTLRDESQRLLYGGINTHAGQCTLLCCSFAELPHARVCRHWTWALRVENSWLLQNLLHFPAKRCCRVERRLRRMAKREAEVFGVIWSEYTAV